MSRVRPGVLLTNANRIPASALMALDLPEFDRPAEVIIEPDGTQVPSAPILLEDYANAIQNGNGRAREPSVRG